MPRAPPGVCPMEAQLSGLTAPPMLTEEEMSDMPTIDPWEGRMHGFDWQLERARYTPHPTPHPTIETIESGRLVGALKAAHHNCLPPLTPKPPNVHSDLPPAACEL
jgi:hypothetical protein